jgi:hypothetical protein
LQINYEIEVTTKFFEEKVKFLEKLNEKKFFLSVIAEYFKFLHLFEAHLTFTREYSNIKSKFLTRLLILFI